MKPTFLDRAIAHVAPGVGLRRLVDRARFATVSASLSGYDAARRERAGLRNFNAQPRTADADTRWAEGFGTLCAKIARIGSNNPGASIRVSHTNGKTGETRTVPVNGRGLIQAIGRDGDTILSGKLA